MEDRLRVEVEVLDADDVIVFNKLALLAAVAVRPRVAGELEVEVLDADDVIVVNELALLETDALIVDDHVTLPGAGEMGV